ncbi:hypothetical protein GF337_15825 [candidate division KSB1 bacterium]|nr:hypothetical protein [candidate division KSB1 bacterium]
MLLIIMIYGCDSQKDSRKNGIQQIGFKVDPALLEAPYQDSTLGIVFSPPKGCSRMPKDIVIEVKDQFKTLNTISAPFAIEPHQIFLNEENHFACILSKLPVLANSDSSVYIYQQAIRDSTDEKQVKQTSFLHNGLLIHQSLIINPIMIQFKLIIPQSESNSFQIDYVIPKSIYADYIEVIESSIGSIKKQ